MGPIDLEARDWMELAAGWGDLAWQVLTLENGTEDAIMLINEEMKAIKDAVQNRIGLDMLKI